MWVPVARDGGIDRMIGVEKRIAGVCTADVRADWTAIAVRVFREAEFVVVAVDVGHERRAIRPSANDLRGEMRGFVRIGGLTVHEVPELGDTLSELTQDEIRTVLSKRTVILQRRETGFACAVLISEDKLAER